MAIGGAAIAAGIAGLPGASAGWVAVPVSIGGAAPGDAVARMAERPDAVPAVSSVTSATAGSTPLGNPGPVGVAVGREGTGTAPGGGGRGIARWEHNRALQLFGLGGGALLLLIVGSAMQRRQAVLVATGRRI
jgi:hypothetical protein